MELKQIIKNLNCREDNLKATLIRATDHILKVKKAKNLVDISRKMNISKSLLSQNLNGDKKPSEKFISNFNKTFNLDLDKPESFTLPDWIDILIQEKLPDVSGIVFLKTVKHMRNRIQTLENMIKSLRNANIELTQANQVLTDILNDSEHLMLKTIFQIPFIVQLFYIFIQCSFDEC